MCVYILHYVILIEMSQLSNDFKIISAKSQLDYVFYWALNNFFLAQESSR